MSLAKLQVFASHAAVREGQKKLTLLPPRPSRPFLF